MTYEFPDRPITAELVRDWVATGRGKNAICPLCGGEEAACCQIDRKDLFAYICATCQRFVIPGPTRESFKRDTPAALQLRQQYSATAAKANVPPVF